jgi:hypothetical protein
VIAFYHFLFFLSLYNCFCFVFSLYNCFLFFFWSCVSSGLCFFFFSFLVRSEISLDSERNNPFLSRSKSVKRSENDTQVCVMFNQLREESKVRRFLRFTVDFFLIVMCFFFVLLWGVRFGLCKSCCHTFFTLFTLALFLVAILPSMDFVSGILDFSGSLLS